MAESLAILGLASSIITFIDFGFKIANGARSALSSPNGTTSEVAELDLILGDIEAYNDHVSQYIHGLPHKKVPEDERRISAMVWECQGVAAELRDTTRSLHRRKGCSKKLEGGRVALGCRNKKDIEDLRRRLEALDTRTRAYITYTLHARE